MLESTIIVLGLVVMILVLAVSIIPYIPGPALVWLIGLVVAISEGFDRITVLAVILMTIFMILGSTTDLWLRALGMRSRGGSCWGTLGSLVGGFLGTMVMPIIGTLIGAVLGALIVEFMRFGELNQAMEAGKSVIEMFILGMIVEFSLSVMIITVFVVSIWTTA